MAHYEKPSTHKIQCPVRPPVRFLDHEPEHDIDEALLSLEP